LKLYTADEMRAIDDHAIRTVGVSAAALMETAGRATAARAIQMLGTMPGRKILVLCGKGNNGGDGLVAARVLKDAGASVEVVFAGAGGGEGPAADNLRAAQAMGIPIRFVDEETAATSVGAPDLCIDALLGVGSRGAPAGAIGALVEAANQLSCPILAVDIPTGLDASTGQVPGACINAAVTVTFGCGKIGLFSDPGIRHAGEIHIVEIGFPVISVESVSPSAQLLDAQLIVSWLPERTQWAHKGDTGTVVVAAGSRGMLGAAGLSSGATLRAGCGLTKLVVPESLLDTANLITREVICRPAPEGPGGTFGRAAQEVIVDECSRAKVLAIGPGLGQGPETAEMVCALLPELNIPMVIDADALNILSERKETLTRLKAPAVLTPHPGEMARLTGRSVSEIQAGRLEAARSLAREYGVIVALKGAATVVADPSGEILLNSTGNGGMAAAGMGDVLTGTIAGLIAQGMPPFHAAGAGVFLHGLAGDRCASRRGEAGLAASDLVEELPAARASLS